MANAKKLNEEQLRDMVKNMALKIMSENKIDLGDPMDQKLNQNDSVGTTSHENELVGSPKNLNAPSQGKLDTEKENDSTEDTMEDQDVEQLNEGDYEDKGDATEVKMNSQDSDKGSDEKAAAAVEVDAAGSTHSGASTKGQKKANFESKKGMNDSSNENGGDDKGTDSTEVDMNTEDKDVDEGTKTYVEAGTELKKGASTGQKDAKWSEDAKNEKADEPIAKGIQLPEGFDKMKFTQTELQNFINEEAKKVAKTLLK